MRVASGFRHGKYISEAQTRNAYDFVGLPRLQEISEHGDMGQQYSADLLRPMHPTAATERTDGVIRSTRSDRRPRKDAFNERTRANRSGASGQYM